MLFVIVNIMVLSMQRWEGKIAIVTGASSGIGAAIAEQLVENGVIVVGVARRAERIEELAKKLSAKKGKLHAVKADISKEDELLKAINTVTKNYGPVHILINNAGVSSPGAITELPTEALKNILDVNVLALTIASREAIKIMMSNKIDGHIININSIGGHKVPPIPKLNIYPASKHAVTAFTETLRQELNTLKTKIKVTSVSPGFVASEMTTLRKDMSANRKERLSKWPILDPHDIADGVIYVLSTAEHVQVHELIIKPVGELL